MRVRRYGFERKDRRARREGGRFRDYQSGHEPGGGALVHCAPCAGHPRLRDTDGGGSLHAHGASILLKLFPAEVVGGVKMLKALGGPYGNMKFMPTGGISAQNAAEYLALPNVLCCGGSWMVPGGLLDAGEF